MKTTNNYLNRISVLFICLFACSALSAQDVFHEAIAVNDLIPKNQNLVIKDTDAKKKVNNNASKFDFSAGQTPAQFDNLEDYVAEHLVYPDLAKENTLEGTVNVLLTISSRGEIIATEITNSLGTTCDEAALEMINEMPRWNPANNYGIPIKSKKMIAINFTLR